jgi:hypothetical protein
VVQALVVTRAVSAAAARNLERMMSLCLQVAFV